MRKSWFDYFDPVGNLQAIAQAVNHTEQAEEVLTQTQQQIASAQEAFADFVATYPRVAFLFSSTDIQTLSIPVRPVGLCNSLVETLGFQEAAPSGLDKDSSRPLATISLEALPDLFNDADILIVLGHNFSDLKQFDGMDNFVEHQLSTLKQAWKKNAITQSLNASQADRVYFIPSYLCAAVPGPIGTELYLEELKEQLLPAN
ncbi:MAG: ABC transporter substrate-binding protein [Leptolyngbya sp. SIOISBB]|nr:ABC transporter substrate-binding protein [Leptolyngbya sp. SIOISBB]